MDFKRWTPKEQFFLRHSEDIMNNEWCKINEIPQNLILLLKKIKIRKIKIHCKRIRNDKQRWKFHLLLSCKMFITAVWRPVWMVITEIFYIIRHLWYGMRQSIYKELIMNYVIRCWSSQIHTAKWKQRFKFLQLRLLYIQ